MEWINNGTQNFWEKEVLSAKKILKKLNVTEKVAESPLDFSLVEFFLDKNLKKIVASIRECLGINYQALLNDCDLEMIVGADKSKTLILTILGESYSIFLDAEKNLVMQKGEYVIFKITEKDDQVINVLNFEGNSYMQTASLDERKYIRQVVYQEIYNYGREEQIESVLYCVKPMGTTRDGYDFFEISDLNRKKQPKQSFLANFFENLKSDRIWSVRRDYPVEMLDDIFKRLNVRCKKEYEENRGVKR